MKSRQRKWYGLRRRGKGVLMVMSCFNDEEPPSKDEFYHHDVPMDQCPSDQVVELELVIKRG